MLLLLLLLSRFSRVRLCATPETAAHQAPLSLGFSRKEHWSELPFPSPRHESEKWKWSLSVVSSSSRPPWTTAYQAPPPMGFSRQDYWSGLPLPSPSLIQYILLIILCHLENQSEPAKVYSWTYSPMAIFSPWNSTARLWMALKNLMGHPVVFSRRRMH